jgi:hypothetical protein
MDLLGHAMGGSSGDGDSPEYATGGDRYLVHLVFDPATGRAQRLDGTPIPAGEAEMALCDASTVTRTLGDDGEILNLGRKTWEWNTSQRRAIAVRDGRTCRFPGCANTRTDIHHLHPWGTGGPTDIANGGSLCRHHHRLVHQGFTATGNANGTIAFYRPDGTLLDTTTPLARNWQLAAAA